MAAIRGRDGTELRFDRSLVRLPDNADCVWSALHAFGVPLEELRPEDLAVPDTFFIMGRAPNQIDIVTTIDGVSFERAGENRIESTYGGVRSYVIGRSDLIANKESAARPQDTIDVTYLRSQE